MSQQKRKISAVVMTFNEEDNIERCLLSVRDLVDEMFVLDSHSTDTTIAIARDLGAKVASHDFDNYASQRRLAAYAGCG